MTKGRTAIHPSAPLPEIGPTVALGPRRRLGRTGLGVFPFALGMGEFARLEDPRAATVILDRYVQSGGNVVHLTDRDDDAASHVGGWIRSRGIRDDVVIAARIGAPRVTRDGVESLRVGVERMLTRLGTDRLDVVTIDVSARPTGDIALEKALATAESLLSSGQARHIGAHGVDAAQLLEARVFASGGYPRVDVLDVPYGLGDRDGYEGDLQRVALPQGVAVMPAHAVPRGLLLADQAPARTRPFRWRSRLLRALETVSRESGLTPAAAAFAWVRTRPGVCAAVVDAFAAHQIDALAPAATAELTRSQQTALDRAGSR